MGALFAGARKSVEMQFKQEVSARNLQSALSECLASTLPDAFTVELSVFGVHCHCDARSGSRRCVVHCFEDEYYIELGVGTTAHNEARAVPESQFDITATGRTALDREVVDAVRAWLAGAAVPDVYVAFAFVDRKRRALEQLEALVLESRPGLDGVTHQLQHDLADIYYLWFRSPERSCRVAFYGKSEHPSAMFHWDDCKLFAFPVNEPDQLAAVLDRWLIGGASPSSLRREFPWLEIGKLADFYEAGKPTEGEFLQSWDQLEDFYSRHPNRDSVLQFIASLRAAGYDRKLRAGQSLWSCILSRSRRHGLRGGQARIVFDFSGEELLMDQGEEETQARLPRAELTPEVDAALQRLAAEPID